MFASVDPYGITGNYTGCCGKFNVDTLRIRYKDELMNRPSRPLTSPPRSLWTDPAF